MMPRISRPPRDKNQQKRTPQWHEEVHREAMAALARARARDAEWRAKRDAERRDKGGVL
jgi:hypothetical protein